MKLPESERRALARRVLARACMSFPRRSAPRSSSLPEPLPEPLAQGSAEGDRRPRRGGLAEGLSADDIREIEAIALERGDFFGRKTA